ncbi:hypothetical protein OH77DRAFT_110800 [Trametes cingulata]|nr:hypothetical protein OH77DRAFT_110800 [Trametes cingulata]
MSSFCGLHLRDLRSSAAGAVLHCKASHSVKALGMGSTIGVSCIIDSSLIAPQSSHLHYIRNLHRWATEARVPPRDKGNPNATPGRASIVDNTSTSLRSVRSKVQLLSLFVLREAWRTWRP